MSHQAAAPLHTVEVRVAFPLGSHRPFEERVKQTVTVGRVREDAMERFGVADDPQYEYYLTHDGDRLANSSTIGHTAGHEHRLKLTLVKELLQG